MTFVPVPATVRLDLIYLCQGETIQNSLYVEQSGAPALDLLQIISLGSDLWDRLKLIYGSYLVLTALGATDLTTQNAPGRLVFLDPPSPGSNALASNPMPNNQSAAIRFTTEFRGRSFRGRNYLPPLSEAQVAGNTIDLSTLNAIQNAYEVFLADCVVQGYRWVVVSRETLGTPRPNGVTTPITNVGFSDRFVDTQRRRLPR